MRFKLYGEPFNYIELDALIAQQKELADLWAHAEDSGSESTYVEVARWNHSGQRWERFAFLKMLDVDMPGSDDEKADTLAEQINSAARHSRRASIVHSMPNWTEIAPVNCYADLLAACNLADTAFAVININQNHSPLVPQAAHCLREAWAAVNAAMAKAKGTRDHFSEANAEGGGA